MIFEILDPGGCGVARLGMTQQELRHHLGAFREFRRTTKSPSSDQFIDAGVMATYDGDGRVSILEFASPGDPRLLGLSVLGLAVAELLIHLERVMGLVVVRENDVVAVPAWEMSFYVPDDEVEGMLLGE